MRTIQELYDNGIQTKITCERRTGYGSSSSGHPRILHFIESDFSVLSDRVANRENLSLFLLSLKRDGYNTNSNDCDVRKLMQDVLLMCGLTRSHFITNGTDVSFMNKRSSHVVDDDHDALNELYDYVAIMRSFYGRREVYGILTTLEEWRVVWLPDCLSPSVSELKALTTLQVSDHSPHKLQDRTLCGTPVLSLFDPNLIKIISSAVRKTFHSPFRPVSLIDEGRCYMKITKTGWYWTEIQHNDVTLSFQYPHRPDFSFFALRLFHEGRDGRVQLVFSEGSESSLAIIKTFDDVKNYEKEKKCWQEVYEIQNLIYSDYLESRTNRHYYALAIPLCFPASHQEETHQASFNLDLRSLVHMNPSVGLLDHVNQQQLEFLRTIESGCLDVVNVAENAIKHLASFGLVHEDLEWRHVALMPAFNSSGEIVEMKPALIDLSSLRPAKEDEDPEAFMLTRLETMKAEL